MPRELVMMAVILAVATLAARAYYALRFVRPPAVVVAQVGTEVLVRVFGVGTVEAQVLWKIGFESGVVADVDLSCDAHESSSLLRSPTT